VSEWAHKIKSNKIIFKKIQNSKNHIYIYIYNDFPKGEKQANKETAHLTKALSFMASSN
jgi:hypothetical protein